MACRLHRSLSPRPSARPPTVDVVTVTVLRPADRVVLLGFNPDDDDAAATAMREVDRATDGGLTELVAHWHADGHVWWELTAPAEPT